MPCNCILDKPLYPQVQEWGPLVWWILHTLAEKAGRQTSPITLGDEQRAWPLFVKELPSAISCPYCRDHLLEYQKQNPFVLPSDYFEWKTYIPEYFYQLHESVNQRLGKSSFPRDQLSTTYASTSAIKETLVHLDAVVMRGVKMGGMSLFNYRAWVKHLNMLRAAIF